PPCPQDSVAQQAALARAIDAGKAEDLRHGSERFPDRDPAAMGTVAGRRLQGLPVFKYRKPAVELRLQACHCQLPLRHRIGACRRLEREWAGIGRWLATAG